jgi:nucleoside 2-deoxyribosyltransferase
LKIYIAHPITGLSGEEALDYFSDLKARLSGHYYVLSPMTGKEYLITEKQCQAQGYQNATSNDHAIFQRDTWMVSQADIVLVDFSEATNVSIGCCIELGLAAFLGKHTVVVMDQANIHRHSFIMDAADIIFETLEEAYNYLIKF